jgi:serine beta-lactamase-like protein LACTB, mitochondrial
MPRPIHPTIRHTTPMRTRASHLRCVAALVAALVVAPALRAQQPCAGRSPSAERTLARRVDSMAKAFLRAEKIPAVSVGVVRCGATLVARGYGTADLESGAAATPATLFRLASVSKPFAAVLAARLAEQGKLDLDAPIQRYVASFPDKGVPITARQLMTHTSGIRHYTGDEAYSTRAYPTLASALPIFASDPLVHAPGAGFTYTTYGYTLLGVAIEAACGTSFMACLEREVLAPGRVRGVREDRQAEIIHDRARPYALDSTGTLRNAAFANTSYKIPGGGLIATGEAVARFADAAMRGVVVAPTTWTRMTTGVTLSDGRRLSYGEGWGIGGSDTARSIEHNGSQQGASTVVYLLPAHGVSVAVLANLEDVDGGRLTALAAAMARAAIPPSPQQAARARTRLEPTRIAPMGPRPSACPGDARARGGCE